MKATITFLLIVMNLTAYEQEMTLAARPFNYARDFKEILEKTQERGSEMSYQKLLIRFLDRDTSLSRAQVLALMIGFTEDPHYKPFEDMETEQEIFDLNDGGSYEEALAKSRVYLQTHPLSLRVLKEVSYSYHELKKEDSANMYMDQVDKIMGAMIYSGNGKKPETAIFSLGLADGEWFIPNIGLKVLNKNTDWDSHNNFMEIIDASKNVDDHINYFFMIQHAKMKIDDDKVNESGDKKGKKKGKKDKEKTKTKKGKSDKSSKDKTPETETVPVTQ